VKREQLEHVLRAAAQIAADPDVLVIGSQSVLGAIPEDALPPAATASIEVDVAFFDDPDDRDDRDDRKSDKVDGAIGELPAFHETFGYYAQGVRCGTREGLRLCCGTTPRPTRRSRGGGRADRDRRGVASDPATTATMDRLLPHAT